MPRPFRCTCIVIRYASAGVFSNIDFEHINHELHRRVVVVEQDHGVSVGFFCLSRLVP